MHKLLALLCLILFPLAGFAQELTFNVIINAEQVQTQERQIFDKLQNALTQFLNTTKWSEQEFENQERIKANLLITLNNNTNIARGYYEGIGQLQYSRPVYGSSYESPVLTFFDNELAFNYVQDQPLIFTENVTRDNLTLTLAYYSLIILGLDQDTFSDKVENSYYERALNIANMALTIGGSQGKGWKPTGDKRNRYFLIENLNSPQFKGLREGLFAYHLEGLDQIVEDPDNARDKALLFLQKMSEIMDVQPISVVLNGIMDAKGDEFFQLFSQAPPPVRQEAATLLMKLDPTKSETYQGLTKP